MTLDGKVRILRCEDDENLGSLLREYLVALGQEIFAEEHAEILVVLAEEDSYFTVSFPIMDD